MNVYAYILFNFIDIYKITYSVELLTSFVVKAKNVVNNCYDN